jgi:hypothetical protein
MISTYVGGTTSEEDTRLGQKHRKLCTFYRLSSGQNFFFIKKGNVYSKKILYSNGKANILF